MGRNMDRRLQPWLHILICMLIVLRTESSNVDITYVESAVSEGAGNKYLNQHLVINCSYSCIGLLIKRV